MIFNNWAAQSEGGIIGGCEKIGVIRLQTQIKFFSGH